MSRRNWKTMSIEELLVILDRQDEQLSQLHRKLELSEEARMSERAAYQARLRPKRRGEIAHRNGELA